MKFTPTAGTTAQKSVETLTTNTVHKICNYKSTDCLSLHLLQSIMTMSILLNSCDVGCFCIDGYFRGEDGLNNSKLISQLLTWLILGVCVPQAKCGVKYKDKSGGPPVVCPFGEHYEECGWRCKETCGVSRILGCRGEKCMQGCFCDAGLGRNINAECVPRVCQLIQVFHK